MARHFLDLAGAAVIKTPHLQRVQRTVTATLTRGAMAAVYGDAGLGKTFAVELAVAQIKGVTVIWLTFPPRPTMRRIARDLLGALLGQPRELPTDRMTDELVDELSSRGRLLVIIDEAQFLTEEDFEFLRYLHDQPGTNFALLFVGGVGCWQVLSRHPMLESRIRQRVSFDPLPIEAVKAVIPNYHPVWHGATGEIVELVDDRYAGGNLRRWASFTSLAADLCAEHQLDCVDQEVAANVFAELSGTVNANA